MAKLFKKRALVREKGAHPARVHPPVEGLSGLWKASPGFLFIYCGKFDHPVHENVKWNISGDLSFLAIKKRLTR